MIGEHIAVFTSSFSSPMDVVNVWSKDISDDAHELFTEKNLSSKCGLCDWSVKSRDVCSVSWLEEDGLNNTLRL